MVRVFLTVFILKHSFINIDYLSIYKMTKNLKIYIKLGNLLHPNANVMYLVKYSVYVKCFC